MLSQFQKIRSFSNIRRLNTNSKKPNNKIQLLQIFIVAICLSLSISVQASGDEIAHEPIVLTNANYQPKHRMLMQVVLWWSNQIKERTNGRVTIKNYFSGKLAKAGEVLPLVSRGGADIGTPALVYQPSRFPLMQLVISYPWKSFDEFAYAVPKIVKNTPAIQHEWDKNNVVPLGFTALPPYGVLSIRNAKNIKELQGCLIRVWGKIVPQKVRQLGMVPVSMPSSEIYQAMSRGTVGCSLSPTDQVKTLGIYGVAKNYLTGDFIPALYSAQPVMNKKTWNDLPESVRKVFLNLRPKVIKRVKKLIVTSNKDDTQFLKKHGVNFTNVSEQENKRLYKVAKDVWQLSVAQQKSQGNSKQVSQVIKSIKKYVKEYQKEN